MTPFDHLEARDAAADRHAAVAPYQELHRFAAIESGDLEQQVAHLTAAHDEARVAVEIREQFMRRAAAAGERGAAVDDTGAARGAFGARQQFREAQALEAHVRVRGHRLAPRVDP